LEIFPKPDVKTGTVVEQTSVKSTPSPNAARVTGELLILVQQGVNVNTAFGSN